MPRSTQNQKRRGSARLVRPPALPAIRGITPGREAEGRAFLLRHACTVHTDFPDKYKRIVELLGDGLTRFGEEDFRLRLWEIADLHRRRFSPPSTDNLGYEGEIKNTIQKISEADQSLAEAVISSGELDIDHLERVAFFLNRLAASSSSIGELAPKKLEEIRTQLSLLKFAIILATGIPERVGKGRPLTKYLFAAWELVDLWEAVTRVKVTTAKGVAKGKGDRPEPTQPFALFVYLGLAMTDPAATAANAINSINSVHKIRSKNRRNDRLASLAKALSR